MPLSAREQQILAGIEDQLASKDSELSDLFTDSPPAPAPGRKFPLPLPHLGLLVVALLVLVLAHPLAALGGAAGVGLLTTALVVPWVVVTARAGARAQEASSPSPDRTEPDAAVARSAGRPRQADDALRGRRAPLAVGLVVWALVVALVVTSGVGLADGALIAVALVMLVGVHVARWYARRALFRRFGSEGGAAGPGRPHPED